MVLPRLAQEWVLAQAQTPRWLALESLLTREPLPPALVVPRSPLAAPQLASPAPAARELVPPQELARVLHQVLAQVMTQVLAQVMTRLLAEVMAASAQDLVLMLALLKVVVAQAQLPPTLQQL